MGAHAQAERISATGSSADNGRESDECLPHWKPFGNRVTWESIRNVVCDRSALSLFVHLNEFGIPSGNAKLFSRANLLRCSASDETECL